MRSLNLFNVIRTSIYAAVILFTVICLAVAANFQSILAASDLTRFIPLSIFVCSFSLLAFFVMLGASWRLKASNPISTRTELMCLGMCGILWLVLGVFLAASPSQSADVDCSSSNSGLATRAEPNVPLSTEKYHAMYHVLNAFALMNATLILAATLGLLFLAYRRHRSGDDHMWRGPVTSCAWFNYNANAKNRRGLLPQTKEKESMTPAPVRRERSRRQSQSQSQSHRAPAPAHTRQHSSRRYNGSSSKELRGFDEGFMRNPYSK